MASPLIDRMARIATLAFCGLIGAAHAQDDFFSEQHSVEAIRAALSSPVSEEIQKPAREFDDDVLRTGRIGEQSIRLVIDERQVRAERLLARLLVSADQKPSDWTLRILDTDPMSDNAFVVGGRIIYVYTGLLESAGSDDELAFILAHEVAHSLLKHGMRQSDSFANLIASLIELGGEMSKSQRRKDKMAMIGGGMKAAYSRADEQEADALGALIAHKAGFDVLHGVGFFNRQLAASDSATQSGEAELAEAMQTVQEQLAVCANLREQWESDPRVRSRENAKRVDSACQIAESNRQQYNEYVEQESKLSRRSDLLRSHPADQERIAALVAVNDYLRGKRALKTLSEIGQGFKVFQAMNLK